MPVCRNNQPGKGQSLVKCPENQFAGNTGICQNLSIEPGCPGKVKSLIILALETGASEDMDKSNRFRRVTAKVDTVLPATEKDQIICIGLGMGIKHFLTRSDGTCIENPRYFEEDLLRMKHLQHDLAGQVKGSADYIRNCQRIARLHERIMARRHAFLHQVSTQIVRENDIIAVEKLALSECLELKNFSYQISDATWRKFITMLVRKAQWYGKHLILIDRDHPRSKICSTCQYKTRLMPLSILEGHCPQYNTEHDRNTNTAINIMVEGTKIYLKSNSTRRQQLIPVLSDRR
jgi:putative transposase